jgi:hypothetical protein
MPSQTVALFTKAVSIVIGFAGPALVFAIIAVFAARKWGPRIASFRAIGGGLRIAKPTCCDRLSTARRIATRTIASILRLVGPGRTA